MAYRIEKLTFDGAVPDWNGKPFATAAAPLSFAGADHDAIYLDDGDEKFSPGKYFQLTAQRLLVDSEFGGTIAGEGSVLTYDPAKVMRIQDMTSEGYYYVMFPHIAPQNNAKAILIGDKTTVLIMPLSDSTPPFDPARSFAPIATQSVNEIRMSPVTIPESYLSVPCFATGTLIETASGPRPVEHLTVGDLVLTRDRGLRPVCWAGTRMLSARHLDISPNLRPVLIRANALGNGLPDRDLVVSPQHRVLISSKIAQRMTGTGEVLIAAKHLCRMTGIGFLRPEGGIGYHHLLFDQHELVSSHGCWTESMFTGAQAMKSVGPAARRELQALFPELFTESAPKTPGVRRFMSRREAQELTRRHLKNRKPLFA
ncbi:Hint domain-containing protein [Paracoccus aerodenitrificans]|uniref:Hint domain-containing protein n=1 Tax=Paracoccus aerodenitrificans TaxID=3017781 RepID=UPI0022F0FDC8|nr:Hint domain-containing protein [Paracoccus aerodenitrificans]WBU62907.1 Hint domain-containing protein [Paracoccus aerodenitrificans]